MTTHDPEVRTIDVTEANETLLDAAVETIEQLVDERDRARALAAKLEEVVAMRTLIVAALADRDPDDLHELIALTAWAKAQLSEIP